MRLASVAYVVPFMFAFQPALILVGSVGEIVLAVATAVVGVILVAIGCAGYLFRPLGWGKRAWVCVTGIALFLPPVAGLPQFVPDLVGLGPGGAVCPLGALGRAPRARGGDRPGACRADERLMRADGCARALLGALEDEATTGATYGGRKREPCCMRLLHGVGSLHTLPWWSCPAGVVGASIEGSRAGQRESVGKLDNRQSIVNRLLYVALVTAYITNLREAVLKAMARTE
jgi:hypothetical protein